MVNALIPYGFATVSADKEVREKIENEQLEKAKNLSIEAQDTLNQNAAFIPEKFYNAYDSILRKCSLQIDVKNEKYNVLNLCENKGKPERDDYMRTKEINQEFRSNNNAIREYLASLDVLD